jgi:hypothetical protein
MQRLHAPIFSVLHLLTSFTMSKVLQNKYSSSLVGMDFPIPGMPYLNYYYRPNDRPKGWQTFRRQQISLYNQMAPSVLCVLYAWVCLSVSLVERTVGKIFIGIDRGLTSAEL